VRARDARRGCQGWPRRRPIRQANGRSEFGELFLTDVQVPAENMIGAENNGWRVAQATLGSERGVIAFEGAERQRYEIEAFYRKSSFA
jgi:alkylation response protein AidB-like acyl-CoA dehydrogenase